MVQIQYILSVHFFVLFGTSSPVPYTFLVLRTGCPLYFSRTDSLVQIYWTAGTFFVLFRIGGLSIRHTSF